MISISVVMSRGSKIKKFKQVFNVKFIKEVFLDDILMFSKCTWMLKKNKSWLSLLAYPKIYNRIINTKLYFRVILWEGNKFYNIQKNPKVNPKYNPKFHVVFIFFFQTYTILL